MLLLLFHKHRLLGGNRLFVNISCSSQPIRSPNRYRSLVVILVGSLLTGCALQSATPALGSKVALTMADHGRPTMHAGDTDADGVLDSSDACPDTTTHVTVNSTGCGLFDAVLNDVTFHSGSIWLSLQARAQLDELAETLLAFPESRVQVLAHTDSRGNRDMNLTLSDSRARVVVQYLNNRGVHNRQLQAVGAGEAQPLASNRTPEGRQSNRRVDIVTLPDQDAGELSVQPALAAARVIVVSDPRQRNAQRDSLISPAGKRVKVGTSSDKRLTNRQITAKWNAAEPALMAAVPARTTGRLCSVVMHECRDGGRAQ